MIDKIEFAMDMYFSLLTLKESPNTFWILKYFPVII